MLYLDTSLLVSAVFDEDATKEVQQWLRTIDDVLAISDWTIVEFASAIEGRTRGGQMLVEQRDAANRWFRALTFGMAELLPVDRFAFRRAAAIVATPGIRVRAADALHLAVAEASGAKVCTLDKSQAEAARACNITMLHLHSRP